jgi:hypothetical protein
VERVEECATKNVEVRLDPALWACYSIGASTPRPRRLPLARRCWLPTPFKRKVDIGEAFGDEYLRLGNEPLQLCRRMGLVGLKECVEPARPGSAEPPQAEKETLSRA